MKTAVSIWCGVMLSLLAARASAQIPTGMVQIRYFGGTYNWTARIFDSRIQGFSSCSGSISLDPIYGDIPMIRGDTFLCNYRMNAIFELDTARDSITGLEITCWGDPPPPPFEYDNTPYATVTFLSNIPYSQASDTILVAGSFLASIHSAVQLNVDSAHVWYAYGGIDSTWRSTDSLWLRIDPQMAAIVKEHAAPTGIVLLSSHAAQVTNKSARIKDFIVSDIVGCPLFEVSVQRHSVVTIPLPSLPPGCYFARLGDEVAKFVVPPR